MTEKEEYTESELRAHSLYALRYDYQVQERDIAFWDPLTNNAQAFLLFTALEMTVDEYICGDYHDWTSRVSACSRWYFPKDNVVEMEFFVDNLLTRTTCFREAVVLVAARIGDRLAHGFPYQQKGIFT